MAHIITCDVCAESFTVAQWKKEPGITAKIPARMLGDTDVPAGEFTFCSWDCIGSLAQVMTDAQVEEADEDDLSDEDDEDVPPVLAQELAEEQIDIPEQRKYAPEQPRLVQVPYAGIRVDGRPLQ